jgi:hypothetical protein
MRNVARRGLWNVKTYFFAKSFNAYTMINLRVEKSIRLIRASDVRFVPKNSDKSSG